MQRVLFHPRNGSKCAFCERWHGNADPVFKNAQIGYEYSTGGVLGICPAKGNSNQPSSGGHGCKNYKPNADARSLMP